MYMRYEYLVCVLLALPMRLVTCLPHGQLAARLWPGPVCLSIPPAVLVAGLQAGCRASGWVPGFRLGAGFRLGCFVPALYLY